MVEEDATLHTIPTSAIHSELLEQFMRIEGDAVVLGIMDR